MYAVENRGHYIYVFIDENFRQFEDEHATHASESSQALDKLVNRTLDTVERPTPVILDLRKFRISFSELVMGLSETNKGESMFRHRNLAEAVVVAGSGIVKLGAMALRQSQYGNTKVTVFNNLEEALAHISATPQRA